MFFGVGMLCTAEGIINDGEGVSTSSVGDKMEVHAVLVQVLTSKVYDGRLLRKVVSQAVECEKGSWMRSIGRCVGKFGWRNVSGGVMRELSEACVKGMLVSVAWRHVRVEWRKEMHEKLKLDDEVDN